MAPGKPDITGSDDPNAEYNPLRLATDLDGVSDDARESNRKKLSDMLRRDPQGVTKNDLLDANKFSLMRMAQNLNSILKDENYTVTNYKGEVVSDPAFVKPGMEPSPDPMPSIDDLYNAFQGTRAPVQLADRWEFDANQLLGAEGALNLWLAKAQNLADSDNSEGWAGQAGDAVRGYLGQFQELTADFRKCVQNMQYACQAYTDSFQFEDPITEYYKEYCHLKSLYEEAYKDDPKELYNQLRPLKEDAFHFVCLVMDRYRKRIIEASKHPDFDKVTLPEAPANVGGPPGSGSPGTGSGGPGSGGVPKTPTTPDLSKLLNNKTTPDTSKTTNPANSIQPLTDAAQSGLQGLGDAASQAANAGQEALQSGLDGAKQLADSLTNGKPAGLDEGALNLGPGGLGALGKLGGAAAGAGKAGGGGGAGMRAPAMPKTTGVQMAEATKAATGSPSASRAGLASGAAGSPGAGAPAAGRGAGADGGKEHKASKALRTKSNGEVVAGVAQADAVLPVLGGEPDVAPPPGQPAKR